MSTVTVTDLPPGTAAGSADVNATLTSWNSATAAGQVGAANVALEGVDRRTMSADAHVVSTAESGSDTIVVSTGPSAAAASTGVYTVVTCGVAIQTNAMTIAVAHKVYIHASVLVRAAAVAAGNPRLLVEVILQQSTDAGVSWTSLVGTRRRFRMRDFAVANQFTTVNHEIPGIIGSATWKIGVTSGGTSTIFRMAFQTTNDGNSPGGVNPVFVNATIFPEIIGA